MKQTLLQITDDMAALGDLLSDCGGDISSPEVEAAITAWESELTDNLHDKLDAYAVLISEMEARAAVRKAEAKRIAERAKVDENSASALRERLRMVFQIKQLPTVETKRYKISLVNNGGKAPLLIEGEVPNEFTKTVTVIEPDKDKIRQFIEGGGTTSFARIGDRGQRISIR